GGGRDEVVFGEHSQEPPEEEILRVHGHVGLELVLPPPVPVLKGEQVVAGPGQRLRGGALDARLDPDRHQKSLRTTKPAISRRSETGPGTNPVPSSSARACSRCRSAISSVHARLPHSSSSATARARRSSASSPFDRRFMSSPPARPPAERACTTGMVFFC